MLVHYIIVRRDLPLGTLAAMVTHAAGESGALYQDPYDGRFRGATAVVLEAKNEADLKDISDRLAVLLVHHTCVWETTEPYRDQLMAIGVVPGDRERLQQHMTAYQTLKKLNYPLVDDECQCSNCAARG